MMRAMLHRWSSQPAPKKRSGRVHNAPVLRIGEPDDAFEREADRIADEVMAGGKLSRHWSISNAGIGVPLRRKCSCGGSGDCKDCKEKEENLQRKATSSRPVLQTPCVVDEVLHSPRSFFEHRLGYSFSRVHIHSDAWAAESARAVSALAYTVGHNIALASNQYAPTTEQGRRLLAHELVHVVQQSRATRNSEVMISRAPEPSVQRACVGDVPCPSAAVERPPGWPWSETAEVCIRTDYIPNHAGNSVGSNNTWQYLDLPPGTLAKRDHESFKSSLMAKSGMFLAQPDTIDFTSAEIDDVTTVSQAQSHRVRLDADTKQATALAAMVDCGGSDPPTMRKWSLGAWVPPTCYWISGDMFLRVENSGALLLYHVLKDVKKELVTIAIMATMAALLKGKKGGGAAGRALAYANLAAIAILLASGKAEAKVGPGEEMPIETLFKSVAQKGTPVPPGADRRRQARPTRHRCRTRAILRHRAFQLDRGTGSGAHGPACRCERKDHGSDSGQFAKSVGRHEEKGGGSRHGRRQIGQAEHRAAQG
jgi:hypothetical protein